MDNQLVCFSSSSQHAKWDQPSYKCWFSEIATHCGSRLTWGAYALWQHVTPIHTCLVLSFIWGRGGTSQSLWSLGAPVTDNLTGCSCPFLTKTCCIFRKDSNPRLRLMWHISLKTEKRAIKNQIFTVSMGFCNGLPVSRKENSWKMLGKKWFLTSYSFTEMRDLGGHRKS